MDRKTTALLSTIAAIVFCGCPGIFSLFIGGLFAVISFIPGADINVGGSQDPQAALAVGLGGLCAGVVLIIIAVVAVIVIRRRFAAAAS